MKVRTVTLIYHTYALTALKGFAYVVALLYHTYAPTALDLDLDLDHELPYLRAYSA